MNATYDMSDETGAAGPFVTDSDVAGLYDPEVAALAGRATACDPGSGPTRIDD